MGKRTRVQRLVLSKGNRTDLEDDPKNGN
jgi:hypothetical protein